MKTLFCFFGIVFLNIFNLLSVSMEFTSAFSCFCNVRECGTNRLCKSKNLGCFSDLVNDSDVRTAKHGCLDILSEDKQSQCQNIPGVVMSSASHKSLLLCCQKDMCNLEPDHFLIFNQTSGEEPPPGNTDAASNAHLWYRTATIAVPICGVLVMTMLVLLGVKILKSDKFDERILMSKLREKHEQCSSSMNSSNCMNIVPLLPPRNPLMGVGVNKLENLIITPCRTSNESKTTPSQHHNYEKPTSLSRTTTSCSSRLQSEPHAEKNCNALTSEQILKDLGKPTSLNISGLNMYPTRNGVYDGSVNCQVMCRDKINYKQSLISNWTNKSETDGSLQV